MNKNLVIQPPADFFIAAHFEYEPPADGAASSADAPEPLPLYEP